MKTIHESIIELLEIMQELDKKGIEVQILCIPPELEPVPKAVTESLANSYLPRIMDFYKNEDNMKAYEKWKQEQSQAKLVSA
ncbi:hypothetical protein RFF05_04410 [Bengtsoniella intestinalis]|uniref:hypothetical protein n=1 Tax=Bengtsoniella intestinalis TaxID=3073143 RepID=UPI00391F9660